MDSVSDREQLPELECDLAHVVLLPASELGEQNTDESEGAQRSSPVVPDSMVKLPRCCILAQRVSGAGNERALALKHEAKRHARHALRAALVQEQCESILGRYADGLSLGLLLACADEHRPRQSWQL